MEPTHSIQSLDKNIGDSFKPILSFPLGEMKTIPNVRSADWPEAKFFHLSTLFFMAAVVKSPLLSSEIISTIE